MKPGRNSKQNQRIQSLTLKMETEPPGPSHPLQSDHQTHDSSRTKSDSTTLSSIYRGRSALERIEAVGARTARGRSSSAHLRSENHRRRRSTNHDTVGHCGRRRRKHSAHAAASRYVDGDLGDVHRVRAGRALAATLGAGLGHVDDRGHGLTISGGGGHLILGVHAGRVGTVVVVHHLVLVHVHVNVLGGLHGPTGVAGWGGHLVGATTEGGIEIVHVCGVLVREVLWA